METRLTTEDTEDTEEFGLTTEDTEGGSPPRQATDAVTQVYDVEVDQEAEMLLA